MLRIQKITFFTFHPNINNTYFVFSSLFGFFIWKEYHFILNKWNQVCWLAHILGGGETVHPRDRFHPARKWKLAAPNLTIGQGQILTKKVPPKHPLLRLLSTESNGFLFSLPVVHPLTPGLRPLWMVVPVVHPLIPGLQPLWMVVPVVQRSLR